MNEHGEKLTQKSDINRSDPSDDSDHKVGYLRQISHSSPMSNNKFENQLAEDAIYCATVNPVIIDTTVTSANGEHWDSSLFLSGKGTNKISHSFIHSDGYVRQDNDMFVASQLQSLLTISDGLGNGTPEEVGSTEPVTEAQLLLRGSDNLAKLAAADAKIEEKR
ncbi:hypothetical protein BGX26_000719 [Mortierella sp. AD094]|nr:hypothetical protein BGX26_000719 [Mortierella sp. AD094]